MKISKTSLLVTIIILLTAFTVNAGKQAIVEVEVIEGDSIEKHAEIISFDEKRVRIDFVAAGKKITDETPYIMTIDGGEHWVMANKPKDRFYCSQMQTEEFFKNLGGQVTHAVDYFNVKAESPTVKKYSRNRVLISWASRQRICNWNQTPRPMPGFCSLNSSTQ